MKLLGILAALAVALYLGVTFAFPDYSHRFRLTLEVETPEGTRTGSSVMESTLIDDGYLPTPGRRDKLEFRGEAVFVDLGSGRNLVGVLRLNKGNADTIAFLALDAWAWRMTLKVGQRFHRRPAARNSETS